MPMKLSTAVLILLFLVPALCSGMENNFKLIRVITDDEEAGYFFNRLSGAVITPCNEIIISDELENTLYHFDSEGKFIKKVGQQGKGPGNFLRPRDLDLSPDGKQIYLMDWANCRIAVMATDLTNIRYFGIPTNIMFSTNLKVLDDQRLFCASFSGLSVDNDTKKLSRINIFDGNGKLRKAFFSNHAMDTSSLNLNDSETLRRVNGSSNVVFAFDAKGEKMLVSFNHPDNPMVFYLYTVDGKMIKRFSHQADKAYGHNHEYLTVKKVTMNVLKNKRLLGVTSVFFCKDVWFVFVRKSHYKTSWKDYDRQYFYLKYDQEGKLLGKYHIPTGFKCFYVSPEGIVLGTDPEAETVQLLVYRVL